MGGQVLDISAFRAMNSRWSAGTSSSMKIASTGHSGTHRPQSMQVSGSMDSICSPSRKASTGQTTTQSVYLQPKQGLVTTWAIFALLDSAAASRRYLWMQKGAADRTSRGGFSLLLANPVPP